MAAVRLGVTGPATGRAIVRAINDAGAGGGGAELLAVPSGFPTPIMGANFYRSGSTYSTDFDPQPQFASGDPGVTTYYIDIATGSDANPGTSSLPWRTIARACAVSRETAPKMYLMVKGGTYGLMDNFRPQVMQCTDLVVVSWDGQPVVCSNECTTSWTLDGSSTYYASVVGQGFADYQTGVWDASTLDEFGDHNPLVPAASVAACKATPNTYYTDQPSGRVYVHCFDGRAPDSSIHVYEAWGSPGFYMDYSIGPSAARVYFENVHFRGGICAVYIRQASTTLKTTAIYKNCSMKYSFGALSQVEGNVEVAFVNCLAAAGHNDGFSYNPYGDPSPSALEIGCEARRAGSTGVPSAANQGSTGHGSTAIVRLNGDYHDNQNDQIADVNTSKVWCIGTTARDPLDAGFAAFRAGNGSGATQAWLEGCTASGATYDIASDAGCTVLTHTFTGSAGVSTGSGSVGTY